MTVKGFLKAFFVCIWSFYTFHDTFSGLTESQKYNQIKRLFKLDKYIWFLPTDTNFVFFCTNLFL